MAISETKGQGWTAIPTQWRKASNILTSTLAAFLFSSHRKREKDRKAHLFKLLCSDDYSSSPYRNMSMKCSLYFQQCWENSFELFVAFITKAVKYENLFTKESFKYLLLSHLQRLWNAHWLTHCTCKSCIKTLWLSSQLYQNEKQNFAWLSCRRYFVDYTQNLPVSALDNVLRLLQISSKSVLFRLSLAERVNTAKTCRKVNPIFDCSLALNRIKRCVGLCTNMLLWLWSNLLHIVTDWLS